MCGALLPRPYLQSYKVTVGLCRVRESLTGNDVARSDGSGKGSGNAPQCGLGMPARHNTHRRFFLCTQMMDMDMDMVVYLVRIWHGLMLGSDQCAMRHWAEIHLRRVWPWSCKAEFIDGASSEYDAL